MSTIKPIKEPDKLLEERKINCSFYYILWRLLLIQL